MLRSVPRAVGVGGPQPEVTEDLLDDRGLVNEGDDSHGDTLLGAEQGIGVVALFDEVRPPSMVGVGRVTAD